MSTGQSPGYHTSEDEQTLHKLGYAQELFRAMGGFQNFAISFTIISILAGCLTSYTIALRARRPDGGDLGLAARRADGTIIALSMAEIASAYPTAGGLYYWASKLGSPGWGWATGWFNLDRPDRRDRGDRLRPRDLRAGALRLLVLVPEHMNDWFGASFDCSTYILYALFLTAAALDQPVQDHASRRG